MSDLDRAIEVLSKNITADVTADDALKITQAILNLKNTQMCHSNIGK